MSTIDLPVRDLEKAAIMQRQARDAGLPVHTAETPYGTVHFTDHGDGHGEIWSWDVITINRREHTLMGGYTKIYAWGENEHGLWRPDKDKPLVVFWEPGLRRLDGMEPTDKAMMAIGLTLGKLWMTS